MKYLELITNNWIDTHANFGYLSILSNGNDRILFDKIKDEVYHKYKLQLNYSK